MTEEEATKKVFERWLSDNTSIVAVFQNQAFDSSGAGLKIALCYDLARWEDLVIGDTRAPDTAHGAGWKYLLIGKARTVEEALALMDDKLAEKT